jgi:excisionase family DNA binding protein
MTTEKLTVSVPEVAKMLGLAKNSVYRACAAGQIPSWRIGKRIVIPLSTLERFLECQQHKPSQQSKS